LYAKFSRCECCLCEVSFLGQVISKGGIDVDPSKVDAVLQWEIRRFFRFVGYYWRFIEVFLVWIHCSHS